MSTIYDRIPETWAFAVRPNGYVYYATVTPDGPRFGENATSRAFGWTGATREDALEGALRSAQEHVESVEIKPDSRLKQLRTERGMNITELADMTGVSRTYLSEIENGHNTNIGVNVAIALADVFGVTLDYLVGREAAS